MYLIGLDIIEKGEIITYREKERDLLLDIRNGKYIDKNGNIMSEFFKIVQKYEDRFIHGKEITTLPKEPDWDAIHDFISSVNEDRTRKVYTRIFLIRYLMKNLLRCC